MTNSRYVSNAKTLFELHQEFLSDIQRRLDDLDRKRGDERADACGQLFRIGSARI